MKPKHIYTDFSVMIEDGTVQLFDNTVQVGFINRSIQPIFINGVQIPVADLSDPRYLSQAFYPVELNDNEVDRTIYKVNFGDIPAGGRNLLVIRKSWAI